MCFAANESPRGNRKSLLGWQIISPLNHQKDVGRFLFRDGGGKLLDSREWPHSGRQVRNRVCLCPLLNCALQPGSGCGPPRPDWREELRTDDVGPGYSRRSGIFLCEDAELSLQGLTWAAVLEDKRASPTGQQEAEVARVSSASRTSSLVGHIGTTVPFSCLGISKSWGLWDVLKRVTKEDAWHSSSLSLGTQDRFI